MICDYFCTIRDPVSLTFVFYLIPYPICDFLYSIGQCLQESIRDPIVDPLYSVTRKFFLHKSNMATNFRCKHKGRSTWDTHPSCVTCRIRNNLLCSRQNPCLFCSTWNEDCWTLQGIRVDKVRRDWETGLRQIQQTPAPSHAQPLATPRRAISTSNCEWQFCGTPTSSVLHLHSI